MKTDRLGILILLLPVTGLFIFLVTPKYPDINFASPEIVDIASEGPINTTQ